MRLVIFPLANYANQLKVDFSSIFSLIYPFDIVETSDDWIIVKKKSFDDVYFQINLSSHSDIWKDIENPIIVVTKFIINNKEYNKSIIGTCDKWKNTMGKINK